MTPRPPQRRAGAHPRAESAAFAFGTRADERALAFPDDRAEDAGCDAMFRGIDVAAPPAVVFRWLCQMRVAPYSYDWIDNLGRRSPRTLVPGLDALEPGQRVMTIFVLEAFAPAEHLTIATPPRRGRALGFGAMRITYWCRAGDAGGTRLLVKLRHRPAGGVVGALVRRLLPWADLVMMRKQLLTFRRLAEASPAPPASG